MLEPDALTARQRAITDLSGKDEQLRASEARFATVFHSSPVALHLTRIATGEIVDVNAVAANLIGYSREELIGRRWRDLAPLPDGSPMLTVTQLDLGKPVPVTIRSRSGFSRNCLATADAITVDGEPCLLVTTVDITEQKRMETALRASEEKYRFLTESMKDVVWTVDLDDGAVTYISPSIIQMVGLTPEEFMAAPPVAFFAPTSQQRILEETARLRSGADAAGQGPRRQYFAAELEAVHRDGSTIWVEAIAFLARSAQTGHIELHGVSREITERKRAEAALRASERRLQLAARAVGLGVWHWNFADNSLDWDERMCEMYAVPEEERITRRYYDAWYARVHPDDRQRAVASTTALRSGSEWDCTYRIVLPDGRIRHIHASSVIEPDEQGQPLRMVGVNQDVTEQKAYEQVLEETNAELERQVAARTAELRATVAELQLANAGKDAFLAAISHELRTPLMGVLSMAELLACEMRGPLNSDQTKYVAAIDESGRRLLETLNNVLLYTQLISSRSITRERCLLSDLSAAAAQAVRPKAERLHQSITQTVDPPDLEIDSDAEGIYNMLRMLLDNAIKFTPEGGGIEVAIRCQGNAAGGAAPSDTEAARAVQIVVSDNGIGMTPAEIAGLFRPFTQIDNTLSRRREGLGIGLAYVYKMAELLGGSVAVASRPEGGSRFTVTLPH